MTLGVILYSMSVLNFVIIGSKLKRRTHRHADIMVILLAYFIFIRMNSSLAKLTQLKYLKEIQGFVFLLHMYNIWYVRRPFLQLSMRKSTGPSSKVLMRVITPSEHRSLTA
jgi:hypothetical protein